MTTYKVKFLPEEKVVEVAEGTTLIDAAIKGGIYLNSLCGGDGLCGECRLQVISGKVRVDKNAIGFFSKEEIENGYVLACQTKVEEDMEVVVPSKSRSDEIEILTEGMPLTYSEPESISLNKKSINSTTLLEPLVSKVYLELDEPTLDDNIADIDRVTRELHKKTRFSSFEISLACLQNLADKLRRHKWRVTVTVARHNNTRRILLIDGGDTTDRNYGLAIDVGTTT
ncbi:MAG: 2Fe-2S iron-sulfur cluster binding domain-containing protein, partial [Dehalococcoidales bacterium]|nr:2Fe-2S iron-sulfur cluster binding domain-containing protein [Dehalococcoidales bacterium]